MRKTKIICTLGPATEDPATISAMIAEGADVFRLNMSHAKHGWVRDVVKTIRAVSEEAGRPIAILMDTQGPAIRTGDVKSNLQLEESDIVEFTVDDAKPEEKHSVSVNYSGFVNDISEG